MTTTAVRVTRDNRSGATHADDTARQARTLRLTISCVNRPGVTALVVGFLHARGAHVVEADQHVTEEAGSRLLLRLVFRLDSPAGTSGLAREFAGEFAAEFAAEFGGPPEVDFRLHDASKRKRVALMVSRYDHCLLDLLWRWRRGELPVDVGLVISNHLDLERQVRAFDVPYVHIPVTRSTKADAERRQLELLRGRFDLVVLARYMQVLSGSLLDRIGIPIINIHHSFLPAFAGPGPYERARQRGVKLVGATAHYVTEDLDEGPIIEQDLVRVSHRDGLEDVVRKGADIERVVLARAVTWHCEDRVLVAGNTTVVF